MSLDSFIRNADQLVSFNAGVADGTIPLTSAQLLKIHISEFKALWERAKSSFEQFMAERANEEGEEENDDEEVASEMDTFQAKYKSTYVTYCTCLAKLSEFLEDFQAHHNPKESSVSPSLPSNSPVAEDRHSCGHSFRLPPCDTEVFDGNYMSWPTFRDMFTAVYIKNSGLSPVERLFHLTQKTRGEARDITLPTSLFSRLPNIKLADPHFHKSSAIDLLVGGDFIPEIMRSGVMHNLCESLMGQETIFGWVLTGPIPLPSPSSTVVSNFCEISLDKEIRRFWEVENGTRKKFTSNSDKSCEELFVSTTTRNKDGRYVVRLPFKEGFPDKIFLGQSRPSAVSQFLRNESRLLRNPNFKLEYDQVLDEYIQLKHMVPIQTPSSNSNPGHYYMPHHSVVKPDRTTTKVRVVFNASAASANGQSLNDILHTGPVLQNDLTTLILKWRLFRFVFNADIQKMYRQILVHSDHTPFQRIVFRNHSGEIIQDFELQTVTFGVNCAPYLAIRTLLQLADDVQSSHPKASSIIRNDMYVDDVLSGEHSLSEAINSKNELKSALSSAGFSLRKWTANSMDILADLPNDHLLCEDFLNFDDSSTAKTLGIRWNARSDSFFFVTTPFPTSSSYTKREILSQISKLFDPAGWLSPCIVVAKIIMQKIWSDDSTIVLSWLSKPPGHWLTFVANRVSNIVQVVNPSKFHHVPSDSNPADLASRGLLPSDIVHNDLWWFGPTWLSDSADRWPNNIPIQDTNAERKPLKVYFSYFEDPADILGNFSSYPRALRVFAYVHRFFRRTHPRFRSDFNHESHLVSSSEILVARSLLVKWYQKVHFPNEYKALSCYMLILSIKSLSMAVTNWFLDKIPILDP
ncbi:uncharacterized protein [Musca autumnalis]|uniref:uncharacterized protein n=1 Tax=Musca autumnalis TaxID=221902 RepID=UPI003CEF20F6